MIQRYVNPIKISIWSKSDLKRKNAFFVKKAVGSKGDLSFFSRVT